MDFIADVELQAIQMTCDAAFNDRVGKGIMRATQGKVIIKDLPRKLSVPRLNAVWHIADNWIVVRVGASQEALNWLNIFVRIEAWVDQPLNTIQEQREGQVVLVLMCFA
ncbi:hypothetical protein D3C76_1142800 [compost metagenome]